LPFVAICGSRDLGPASIDHCQMRELLRRSTRELEPDEFGGKPFGPKDLKETLDWPFTIVGPGIFDGHDASERRDVLKRLLKAGLNVYTEWSGFDCERWCLSGLHDLFEAELGVDIEFTYMRSCDIAPLPMRILVDISKSLDAGKGCVIYDILSRLPDDARQIVNDLWPSPGDPVLTRSGKHDAIYAYCKKNSSRLFHTGATAPCVVHNKRCCMWQSTLPQGVPVAEAKKMRWEEAHYDMPLKIVIGTNSCVPWSLRGQMQGDADEEELPNAVWRGERHAAIEDVFFGECTPRYPVKEKLINELPKVRLLSIVFGPHDIGEPAYRTRLMYAGVQERTTIWTGPEDHVADFRARFFRQVQLDGDVFFIADEAEVGQELRRLATMRGTFYDVDAKIQGDEMMLDVLPPGAAANMNLWTERREQFQGKSKALLADIMHAPGSFASGGPLFPVLTKNMTCYSFKKQRPAFGFEHVLSLGLPIVRCEGMRWTRNAEYMKSLKNMSENELKMLGGNGVHLACMGAWIAYVLSHCVRRKPDAISRSVFVVAEVEDDEL
jgi:hypothetical protein